MEGIEEVRQIDDTHLRWRAKVAGKEKEWTAEITEQHPDERIAWKNLDGAENAGEAVGLLDRLVRGDLERFKQFIESRGAETGAWRDDVKQDPSS